MSPGMTVVPRQSTTTSAPAAPVFDAAPRAAVHDGLRRRVEHLVLELAPAELGADEVPDELDELDALARGGGGGFVVPLGVGAGLLAREGGLRGRHGLEGAAGQLAERPHHV